MVVGRSDCNAATAAFAAANVAFVGEALAACTALKAASAALLICVLVAATEHSFGAVGPHSGSVTYWIAT